MDDKLCHSLNHRAVLQLFRAAHGVNISTAGIADIQAASAEDIVRISSSHGIAPMIADGLERLDENQLEIDRDLRIFFQEIREGNRLRNQKMKAQLTEAAAILADENIPVVVLKGGCELVTPSYQQPHGRFIGDLDLLVSKVSLERAVLALELQGYFDAYEDDEFYNSPEHHDSPLINERWSALIEMHVAIGGKNGEQLLPAYQIIETAEESIIRNVKVPSRLSRLIHLVFHGQIQHLGFQNRLLSLRSLADTAALIENQQHIQAARHPFEASGLHAPFDGLLAATDFILPGQLPPIDHTREAKKWALSAISRLGTPRRASLEIQIRKVLVWTNKFATDSRVRSIYKSKLSKPGRFRRMLQTLQKFRQY